MKKLGLLLIAFACIFITSCKDDEENETPKLKTIVGEWIWVKSYGGISGGDLQTPENTNSIREAIFKSDGTVIMTVNGDTTLKSTYSIIRDKSIFESDSSNVLVIDKLLTDISMRYAIMNVTDSLILAEDVCDGYGHLYVRKK